MSEPQTTSSTDRLPRPSAAERVRTALAAASVATVTTYPRSPGARPHQAVVRVRAESDGCLCFALDNRSAAVRHLLARPVANLRIAGPAAPGSTPGTASASGVVVFGGVRRARGVVPPDDRVGSLAFVLDVTSARLCGPGADVLVDGASYRAAEPDPLRREAPALLAHLGSAHGAGLLHCLRRQGHPRAEWVEPRGLDRYGLEVLVVSADAVGPVRLPFPRPLRSLDELGPGLRAALCCRCGEACGDDQPGRA